MKSQTYIIVYQGKFLEADSMLELKAGTTEDEWFNIVKETVEMYCYMHMAKTIGPN